MLFAAIVAGGLYTATQAGAEQQSASYTVVPGDTLWSIVVDHYPPSEDPRVIIEDIRQTNGLEGYQVHSGTRLNLPPIEA